jgi:hypothetical protein
MMTMFTLMILGVWLAGIRELFVLLGHR